jgi:hypothetical protein
MGPSLPNGERLHSTAFRPLSARIPSLSQLRLSQVVTHFENQDSCRRKMEMSPGVQSRDDTRVPDGHEQRDSDCISAGELSSAFDCRAGSGLNYYVGDR